MRSERAVLQDIGRNVKALRKAHGLSQPVLAELVGVGQHSIGRIESCTSNVTITTLIAIATYFRIDVLDLCAPATARVAARHKESRPNTNEIERMIQVGKTGQRLKRGRS